MGVTFTNRPQPLVELTPLGSHISWQDGPVGEVGVTGDQPETLIPVIIARLETISNGQPDIFTHNALHYLERAQANLLARKKDRLARGVEGTNEA